MREISFFIAVCFCFSCMNTNSQIIENIEALTFKTKISEIDGLIIDVRTPEEFSSGYIADATNIDFYANDFDHKLNIISKNQPIYIYCRSGGRSSAAAKKLEKLGFNEVYNLSGGISSWNSAGYKINKLSDRSSKSIKKWNRNI